MKRPADGPKARDLHEKRAKLWNASLASHEKYIDPETGLFDTKFVETRVCPACSSSESVLMFHKAGGSYVGCEDCRMVFLNPVLTDEALREHYATNHGVQAEIVEEDSGFYTRIYERGLQLIAKETDRRGLIFDFGCSAGFFLDVAKRTGWQGTWGVELNRSEFDAAKQKGHTVYNQPIEQLEFDGRFDAITLWDAFEHLKDGAFFLRLFKGLLADDGVLFLQIPNSSALAARIMQEKCNMFDGLEHVNLYGPETIRRLASDNGYETRQIETVISEFGVLNNFVHYEDAYRGDQAVPSELLGILDEDTLHRHLLGYKIQIVLKPAR